MNIAVLCSGNGSNLQAIMDAADSGYIRSKIAIVISDNKEAHALVRAQKSGIPALFLDPKKYKTREDFDKDIVRRLDKLSIGLVALAGYMRLLSPYFIKRYKNRVMNIHPALLPSFKGIHGVRDAIKYGAKVTGATVHFVDEELDHGPIILQKGVEVKIGDSEDTLSARIHKAEHKIYPEAVKLFTEGKLKISGRIVKIGKE